MGGAGDAAPRAYAIGLGGRMNYDTRYSPPALVIDAEFSSIGGRRRRKTVSALLDTGSDITAIPATLVEPLGLYPIGRLQLEDVAAELTDVYTYAAGLHIADMMIPRLEVILTQLDFAVIGRDVLNLFYLRLDGPELAFAISSEK